MSVYLTEFPSMNAGSLSGGGILLPLYPPLVAQKLATGAVSAAFSPSTRILMIATDAIISFKIDVSTALVGLVSTSDMRLPANLAPILVGVSPGQFFQSIANT